MKPGNPRAIRVPILAACLVLLVASQFLLGDPYIAHILIVGGIYGILAIGLNIVTGICGQINLGMAGFYAIGSYTSALLSMKAGLGFWPSFAASIFLSAVVGVIIGMPALKVRGGVYLVLVTTSFAGIIQTILNQWVKLTNGPIGIVGIPSPSIFGYQITTLPAWLVFVYALAFVFAFIAMRIEGSKIGRSLVAVRESETSAQSLGINLAFYKVLAFALSAAFGGAAGSMYAHYMTTISPDIYGMNTSVMALTMIVVGGVGSIPGSIIGGIIVATLPELLRPLKDYQMIAYAFLIVVATIYLRKGVMGVGIDADAFFRRMLPTRGNNGNAD